MQSDNIQNALVHVSVLILYTNFTALCQYSKENNMHRLPCGNSL